VLDPVKIKVDRCLRNVVAPALRTPVFDARTALRSGLLVDSLGLVTLAFLLQEEFKVNVVDRAAEFGKLQTVEDLYEFVCSFNTERSDNGIRREEKDERR